MWGKINSSAPWLFKCTRSSAYQDRHRRTLPVVVEPPPQTTGRNRLLHSVPKRGQLWPQDDMSGSVTLMLSVYSVWVSYYWKNKGCDRMAPLPSVYTFALQSVNTVTG